MLGDSYLIGLTKAQELTFPGQASFAIPGDKRICRDCRFWAPRQAADRKGRCEKAAAMMRGQIPPVPRTATACKFFEAPPV